MNQTFFIAYLKEDFSSHGINDILHLPVTEETMNQVLLKWARQKSCEGKETNLDHWTGHWSQLCDSQFCRAESVAGIFQRGRGVTLCQSEGTHQIIMSFSLPVVGYLHKKGLQNGGVEESQAPQDSLVMRLHGAQCVWRWTEESHWLQHRLLDWRTIFAMLLIKFLTF